MRAKIFVLTFGVPILFAAIILSVLLTKYSFFNLFVAAGIVISTLIRIFFIRRQYLKDFIITNRVLNIHYLTPFLKSKRVVFAIDEITAAELVKANWLADYPATINIKDKNGWSELHLLNNKLGKRLLNELAAANIGLLPA